MGNSAYSKRGKVFGQDAILVNLSPQTVQI